MRAAHTKGLQLWAESGRQSRPCSWLAWGRLPGGHSPPYLPSRSFPFGAFWGSGQQGSLVVILLPRGQWGFPALVILESSPKKVSRGLQGSWPPEVDPAGGVSLADLWPLVHWPFKVFFKATWRKSQEDSIRWLGGGPSFIRSRDGPVRGQKRPIWMPAKPAPGARGPCLARQQWPHSLPANISASPSPNNYTLNYLIRLDD